MRAIVADESELSSLRTRAADGLQRVAIKMRKSMLSKMTVYELLRALAESPPEQWTPEAWFNPVLDALSEIGGTQAADALANVALRPARGVDCEEEIVDHAITGLGHLDSPSGATRLAEVVVNTDLPVARRQHAAQSLKKSGGASVIATLKPALTDEDTVLRTIVAHIVVESGAALDGFVADDVRRIIDEQQKATTTLPSSQNDLEAEPKAHAEFLRELDETRARQRKLFRDPSTEHELRRKIAYALGAQKDEASLSLLLRGEVRDADSIIDYWEHGFSDHFGYDPRKRVPELIALLFRSKVSRVQLEAMKLAFTRLPWMTCPPSRRTPELLDSFWPMHGYWRYGWYPQQVSGQDKRGGGFYFRANRGEWRLWHRRVDSQEDNSNWKDDDWSFRGEYIWDLMPDQIDAVLDRHLGPGWIPSGTGRIAR